MLQTLATHNGTQNSSAMISWFIDQAKAPLRMDEKSVAGHRYFLCSSGFQDEVGFVSVCGRGLTKVEAATRCIGEWLERKAAFEFFRSKPSSIWAQAIGIDPSGKLSISSRRESYNPLLMEFWTTNGWAIHTDQHRSIENALSEALERSLLVSSFLRWRWQGFIEIGKLSITGMGIHSCLSRYRTETTTAGFAICTNPVTQGLSFGHFSEATDSLRQSSKWAQALYEAVDKLGADIAFGSNQDPLAAETLWYMSGKTDFCLSDDRQDQEKIKFSSCCLHSIDLAKKWDLPFPLFASFVFGGDLMPLFVPRQLTEDGRKYVIAQANSLGFDPVIPERMPVL